jgi:CRISPR/Cas system-associated exonuclease Cas4 (RecB family)
MAYSYSRLEFYESCPWAYKKVYVDGIKRPANEALETGRTLHDRIAGYLERLIKTKSRTDWQWAEARAVAPGDAAAIWQRFVQNFTLPDLEDPGVENQFGFDRNWNPVGFFAPEVRFRGVIDFHFRQNGLAVVVDWKTNRKIPESIEKNLQLRIYGWAVKRAVYPEVEEILLKLHFLHYGANRQVLLTPDDLVTVPAELDEKIARIEADTKFAPAPGSFCGWCGVANHCPEMAKALAPVEIMHPVHQAEAFEAAKLLLAVQVMSQALKEGLKAYVKENGPVVVGDLVYGPYTTTAYGLNPQEVTGYLLDKGVDREAVWGILSLTKDSLEKGLRQAGFKGRGKKAERDALMRDILAQAPVIKEEKIGFRKIKEEEQPAKAA